jgi:hypothetical protein
VSVTETDILLLAQDTPPEAVKQRQGPGGRMLDYIDARFVMDRLDELGPANWQDRYEDRPNGSVRCGIGINVDGNWVWKWDVGDESDIEADKGAHSGAFKRAGVKWGIGRDLYGASTNGTGRAAPPPARPAAVSRPSIVADDPTVDLPPPWEASDFKPSANPHEDVCPDHNVPWTLKEAGTSKAGKPYDAFWKCDAKTDGEFCKNKPSRQWQARHEA